MKNLSEKNIAPDFVCFSLFNKIGSTAILMETLLLFSHFRIQSFSHLYSLKYHSQAFSNPVFASYFGLYPRIVFALRILA